MRGARLSAFDGTGNCFLRSRTSACERLQLSDLNDSVLFFPSERPERPIKATRFAPGAIGPRFPRLSSGSWQRRSLRHCQRKHSNPSTPPSPSTCSLRFRGRITSDVLALRLSVSSSRSALFCIGLKGILRPCVCMTRAQAFTLLPMVQARKID